MEKTFDIAGIGSTVVDYIYSVDSILGPESKGFIRQSRRLLGGVVLNHLCWARVLGLRSALFGIGGDDENGRFLRQGLDEYGVSHKHFLRNGSRTAQAAVYVDGKGERAIYMDPAATAETKPKDIGQFRQIMRQSRFISTEISQLKIATSLAVLKGARQEGCQTFLDLDLPPSYATGEGKLGSPSELLESLKSADFLKASVDAAVELVGRQAPEQMAKALHAKLKKRQGNWVALTAGAAGSALSNGREHYFIPAQKGIRVLDSTGAGDAFMGGLIAGTHYGLKLKDLGMLANAAGAASVCHWGAVPALQGSREKVLSFYGGTAFKAAPFKAVLRAETPGFIRVALKELERLVAKVDPEFFKAAVDLIVKQEKQGGRLHVTGIGKCEYVARYIASSYSSTGWPSFFLHGTEAVHGACGQVKAGEVVIAISNSGETQELKAAVGTLKRNGAKIIGVSGKSQSWLARQSDVFLYAGVQEEGDRLNLAPRASILAQILVLSGLGVELQHFRGFQKEHFRQYHPAGSLGKR